MPHQRPMPWNLRLQVWLARKMMPRQDEWHERKQCPHGCCMTLSFIEGEIKWLLEQPELSAEASLILLNMYNDIGK